MVVVRVPRIDPRTFQLKTAKHADHGLWPSVRRIRPDFTNRASRKWFLFFSSQIPGSEHRSKLVFERAQVPSQN